MSSRITERDLELRVKLLNRLMETPETPWMEIEGRYKANIGCYHLSHAYGGVSLQQMLTEGGGVRDIFGCGHTNKRDLYNRINAYISGIEDKKANIKKES